MYSTEINIKLANYPNLKQIIVHIFYSKNGNNHFEKNIFKQDRAVKLLK